MYLMETQYSDRPIMGLVDDLKEDETLASEVNSILLIPQVGCETAPSP